jgi:hypothetical protein
LVTDRIPVSINRLHKLPKTGFQEKMDHLLYPVPHGHKPFSSRIGDACQVLRNWLIKTCTISIRAAEYYAVVTRAIITDLHFIGSYNQRTPYYTIPELVERINDRTNRSTDVVKYKELLEWQKGDIPYQSKHGPYVPMDLIRSIITESE